ncbi:MAG TPA: PP2C family protein-serine/threonine phosphatase [Candidatus Acidoferrum sp.]|nr:PP2C family protein-serine/threonine phosphatase [Candidatus Acidoferrum sp.]
MSAPPQVPRSAAQPRFRRTHEFWQRVSEGRNLDILWGEFAADARASYGFYGKDVDWEQMKGMPQWRRPLHIAKQFFWALALKLSPARRVLLVLALVFLAISSLTFHANEHTAFEIDLRLIAGVLLLVLLSLELADKVIMKRDLEIAREIQSWLVPSLPPQVPGADIAFATRPQNSVAGDYYDAFYPGTKRNKLLVVIADVAGKSIPAALLMATLQASLRTIAGEEMQLGDMVLRLNRYASAHSLDGRRFTTAVLAEYDLTTRRMIYVNAGHNPPILRKADGTLEKLETGGMPLGITAQATYETAEIQLAPGDALIFYTDGVVEAFNQQNEEYGNPRWLAAIRALPEVSAEESLRGLMRQVDAFVGTTRQSDDITCLIFRASRQ